MIKIFSTIFILSAALIAKEPLPFEYSEIEIFKSTIDDVLSVFGNAKKQEIPYGHHDQGYCYASENGVYAVFSSGPMGGQNIITRISIQSAPYGLECTPIAQELPYCLGGFCLGISKHDSEVLLDTQLEQTTDGSGSYVQSNWTKRKLTESEKEKMNLPGDIDQADVKHNIFFQFKDNQATQIGIIKYECF